MDAKEKTALVTKKACALIRHIHNPPLGATEFKGGYQRECADAIFFAMHDSFLIETKISRSDFLADKKKPFRQDPSIGIGKYRYYACPKGLISVDELPEKWGLIYVDIDAPKKRAAMVHGFGGWKDGEWFGSDIPEEAKEEWNHPLQPSRLFAFQPNYTLERIYLFALATRYKTGKHMDNILST